MGAAVRQDVRDLNERVEDFAQLIGLGLVAETLSHELSHVNARLRGQLDELRNRPDVPPWLRSYLQETRAALDVLQGQVRHLDPMLRYARNRRESIGLAEFAEDIAAFHRPRLTQKRIDITVSGASSAVVRVNRGRLTQVFDNLLVNAEYWLEQALRAERLTRGHVEVIVEGATFSFRDNGPGVDRSLQPRIFEPFVTAKSDRGRGLGLYICRQLLDLDEGRIELTDHRNSHGRSDTFKVSFEADPGSQTAEGRGASGLK